MIMAKSFVKPVIFLSFVIALGLGFSSALPILDHDQHVVTTYIVHLEKPASSLVFNDDDLEKWYTSFLPKSLQTSDQMMKRMVHSYRNLFTGFAVKLTAEEAKALTLLESVVSIHRQQEYSLHTTHTPSFLGLRQDLGLWRDSSLGKGVIIGVIDSGIFPDHPSFSDEGMPPPPAKWKGSCDFNGTLCNNKLIGAQNFVKDNVTVSPIDGDGHGTHTSSTAAGNFVVDANVLGQAKGTAAGIAPFAHVAMYRVCAETCFESDILAAMDAAVGDGVDILSLSLGGGSQPFYTDGIALGAFGAIQKGIFVSCSAGNSGPSYNTLSNEAPWILTFGASTVDRVIKATARLGNGAEYDGQSLFQPASFNSSTLLPLVYPGSVGEDSAAAFCQAGSLRNASVNGKIVVCARGGNVSRIGKGQEVKDAGGAGMILINTEFYGFSILAEAHVVPATSVSYKAGLEILAYINSTSNPTATIVFKGTIIGDPTAPAMASFSSRGPSVESPGILKPDITGPGVNILAAWPFSLDNSTITKANFNIISGTSMSCPHLSGIAALLKSLHPNWSPAAIKSAIMTSANTLNLEKKPIIDETGLAADIFAVGAGHVNPSRAQNPGFVYDLTPEDYIPYLCGLGYSDRQIMTIVQSNVQCSQVSAISEAQLNYPSFSVILGSTSQTYTRTVTNVGPVSSTYTYTLDALEGVDITVTPSNLTFSETSQMATYTITFSVNGTGGKNFSQGALTWSSGLFSVRSPIAVIFKG